MKFGPTITKLNENGVTVCERVHAGMSDLTLLGYSMIEVKPGYLSSPFYNLDREALLTCSDGSGNAIVKGKKYPMAFFDMIYIPENTPFQLEGGDQGVFQLGMATAPSQMKADVVYIPFAEVKADPVRTRPMANKVNYINFSEKIKAQNLVAGFCFFEPYTRSFPAHMHTDQEEIYHFLSGKGAMEIYPSEEKKTFIYQVEKGTIASIPLEHYHPVFAQETPLVWLWVIAGERYWIGDRDAKWMASSTLGK